MKSVESHTTSVREKEGNDGVSSYLKFDIITVIRAVFFFHIWTNIVFPCFLFNSVLIIVLFYLFDLSNLITLFSSHKHF